MKRISALLILLMPVLFAVQAQNKADKILEQFSANMQSKSSITAEFEYRFENTADGLSNSYNGILNLKGDMFRLEIAGQIIMSDGISLWTFLPDDEEVQLNSLEETEGLFTPAKLFASYTEDYKATYNKEYTIGPKTIHVIDLEPNDKSQGFTGAQMELDKNSLELISFSVFDKNNNKFSYIVNKFFTGKVTDDSIFVFDASEYPDVEIIDMR